MYRRIDVTEKATDLINELKERHGELMFHQSGGCCDGSQPMCFPKGEFKIGGSDVCLGEIEGCEFWMSKDQFEYWKHTHLTLNAVQGRGASFSLEIPTGKRFIIESRLFTEEEQDNLEPLRYKEEY
ncbi:hypothetical protein GCM10007424_21130 [Flavobacterium suaedae]|uniref:DUF779 domain-containing protein n=1 Tax=Flavobacterium suaedae TaxID=1767027 RepID=A0ABQ1JYS9_9FLAO|nr:DUF779 domain-containing protein [Flavobacterium suaedae]GGB80818.1 hypothetical protein GCM10007424_21130 [Flavobacterium suaedae]